MNHVAIIFAGGTGQRMNSRTKPKQFLELHGKPILVYTLEKFEKHQLIDGIVLVILDGWVDYCLDLKQQYRLSKIGAIITGGATGQESIFLGLEKAAEIYGDESIALIHDGVRPLIDAETITNNIDCVHKNGTAITVTQAIETVTVKSENGLVGQVIERSRCELARAPQSFFIKDLLDAHHRAKQDSRTFIDSASLMKFYGHPLYTVEGPSENIKITTPLDFYIFRAIIDAKENSQIFGF